MAEVSRFAVSGAHHVVGRHALHRPDALAVCEAGSGRQVTYGELWRLAGTLAIRLAAVGTAPGDACCLVLDRSADLVVAMLAVARLGAYYAPLDTGAPARRNAAQVTHAGARCLITAAGGAARAAALGGGLPVVEVPGDAGGEEFVDRVHAGGDDMLYVNFTSGTSGRPKAVLVPHRAVRRLVDAPVYCDIGLGTRVGNAANPAFDATTFEIWAPLSALGTVVVLPPVATLGLAPWLELARYERVDVLFLTTSLFHIIAREQPAGLGFLDTLLVGGEALTPEAARRVLAAGPPRRLVNLYGPTETTVFASYYDLTADRLDGVSRVPIGHPIQHTTLHVVDSELRPVPAGERGELCVGGPGVALGYLGRPDLTAERFVTTPTAPDAGVLYRTGDVVRQATGGELEIFGRLDRQVKIRGFRVELEEIEHAAVATGLAEAAVVEKLGDGPAATLVGFTLPAADASACELRAALAAVLPAYMVPATWYEVAELPLGPTGKVDREALLRGLAADDHRIPVGAPGGPAGDHVSREVHRLWCELLGVEDAGVDDNFIESGGNSILAIQLSSRISEAISVRLGPADVLLAADLTDLVDAVRLALSTRGGQS